MICVNHVTLVGIVTKIWKNEKSWKFNIETTKPSHDGSRTFTTGHTCVVFGNAIRHLPHMEEGMWIHVEGELNRSSYENKDGKTVWSTNVVTRNVQASAGSQDLGNPNQGQHQGAYPPPSNGNGYRPPVPPQSHGGQQQYQQQPQQQQQQQPQQQQYQQQPVFNSEDVPF